MDLDKLKKSWNNMDMSTAIEEDNIRNIIHSKTKTSLDKLIRIEKIGFILILPLIGVPFWVESLVPLPRLTIYIYIIFCVLGLFWQGAKLSLLKKIDILKTDIIHSSRYILKYRLYLKFEILIGIVYAFIFNTTLLYGWRDRIPEHKELFIYTINIIAWLCIYLFIFYIYKKLYYQQIKKIETALLEVNDVEKNN